MKKIETNMFYSRKEGEKGVIRFEDVLRIKAMLKEAGMIGGDTNFAEFDVIIRTPKRRKTKRQLGYWRAEVLRKIAFGLRDTGQYPDWMDEDVAEKLILNEFRDRELVDEFGVIDKMPGSVSEMDKEQMSQLIDIVIRWGEEYLGVTIFSPLVYYEMKEKNGVLSEADAERVDELREEGGEV